MTAYTHTIFPGYVDGDFFSNENIEFMRSKLAHVLGLEFKQQINFDRASIIRLMQRVQGERLETIPKMNQRVIMYAANEFRTSQMDARRHLNWEEHYVESQRLYDPTVERGPDLRNIKLANRFGKPRVGGTARFVFV